MHAFNVICRAPRSGASLFLAGLLLLSITAGVSAQSASGVFYDCDMTPTKKNEFWVSSKIGVVVLDSGEVVVSDAVTINYGVNTVSAAVQRNTDSEIRLNWRLEGGLREGKYLLPDAEYTATISKPSNRIKVRGKLPGIRRSFSGKGQCTLRTK